MIDWGKDQVSTEPTAAVPERILNKTPAYSLFQHILDSEDLTSVFMVIWASREVIKLDVQMQLGKNNKTHHT